MPQQHIRTRPKAAHSSAAPTTNVNPELCPHMIFDNRRRRRPGESSPGTTTLAAGAGARARQGRGLARYSAGNAGGTSTKRFVPTSTADFNTNASPKSNFDQHATRKTRGGGNGRNARPSHEVTLFDHLIANASRPERDCARARRCQSGKLEGDVVDLLQLSTGNTYSSVPAAGEGSVGPSQRPQTPIKKCPLASPRLFSVAAEGKATAKGPVGGGVNRPSRVGGSRPVIGRVVDGLTPKPGKQRVGPRKKKLSSLKKKILLDRAERWRQLEAEMIAQSEHASQAADFCRGVGVDFASGCAIDADDRQNQCRGCRFGGGFGFSEEAAVVRDLSGDVDAVQSNRLGGTNAAAPHSETEAQFVAQSCCQLGGGSGDGSPREYGRVHRKWIVIVHHIVDEEDVEDDDEYAEIVRDLLEMASVFGRVLNVDLPRKGKDGLGIATVAFATLHAAEAARAGFHGRVVGGQRLQAELWQETDATSSPRCPRGATTLGRPPNVETAVVSKNSSERYPDAGASGRQGHAGDRGRSLSPVCSVVVKNLIDQEDLEGDDDYEEVCRDVSQMVGGHGRLLALSIPRMGDGDNGNRTGADGHREGVGNVGVVIAKFGSMVEAETCQRGMDGKLVGGKILEAELISPPNKLSHQDSTSSIDDSRRGSFISVLIPRDLGHTTPSLTASSTQPLAREERGQTGREEACQKLTLPLSCSELAHARGMSEEHVGRSYCRVVDAVEERREEKSQDGDGRDEKQEDGRGARWSVLVKNLIEKDDLEDDEEYNEVCSDFAAMAGSYGSVLRTYVPRVRRTPPDLSCGGASQTVDVGVACAVFGCRVEAETCSNGLNGRTIAGKTLEAEIRQIFLPLLSSQPAPIASPPTSPRISPPLPPSQPPADRNWNGVRGACSRASPTGEFAQEISTVSTGRKASSDSTAEASRMPTGKAHAPPTSRPLQIDRKVGESSAANAAGERIPSEGGSNGGVAAEGTGNPVAVAAGKRMPEKYREAAALPRLPPPVGDGRGGRRAYVDQVSRFDGGCRWILTFVGVGCESSFADGACVRNRLLNGLVGVLLPIFEL